MPQWLGSLGAQSGAGMPVTEFAWTELEAEERLDTVVEPKPVRAMTTTKARMRVDSMCVSPYCSAFERFVSGLTRCLHTRWYAPCKSMISGYLQLYDLIIITKVIEADAGQASPLSAGARLRTTWN